MVFSPLRPAALQEEVAAALGRLALTYERAMGTARFEGTVAVREPAIHVAP